MKTELTSEEKVTSLLVKNSILKPQYQTFTSNTDTLGKYLSNLKLEKREVLKKDSKYSFINNDLKWL